ncbi:hypothetical protein [Methylobacterium sp. ID0610]|uniref:hypothetical protein n=1 Tax=Methylobacterium carpenticola TaxID=3344827 RepID=UPI0036CE876E
MCRARHLRRPANLPKPVPEAFLHEGLAIQLHGEGEIARPRRRDRGRELRQDRPRHDRSRLLGADREGLAAPPGARRPARRHDLSSDAASPLRCGAELCPASAHPNRHPRVARSRLTRSSQPRYVPIEVRALDQRAISAAALGLSAWFSWAAPRRPITAARERFGLDDAQLAALADALRAAGLIERVTP